MSGVKQPDVTRQRILDAADEEFHRNGFRAASLDAILKRTGVTKGALYYHFPNKLELGYAVLEEVIGPRHWVFWEPMENAEDPIICGNQIIDLHMEAAKQPEMIHGCALSNLSTEMSPVDEGFRTKILCMIGRWHKTVAEAFARGQKNGVVRKDVNPEEVAAYLMAGASGCITVAKNAQSYDVFKMCMNGMREYLKALRPEGWQDREQAA